MNGRLKLCFSTDCGINCHKHCKDRIVQECRPKAESKSLNSSHSKKRDKRKEKQSLSSESDLSVNGGEQQRCNVDEKDNILFVNLTSVFLWYASLVKE